MATHRVDFDNESERIFMTNYRRGPEYNCTIQNNSGAALTVEVTNRLLQQGEAAAWTDPESGALSIPSGGVMGYVGQPYVAFRLDAGGPTTGTVRITESG